ncbi:MAG: type II toxin-antitoxin system VapC family toxin [Arhodomonas sp.]|nr:type II toxin-antitoxin system VapC family toxin [Arhodomonas sp.]
MRFVLDNSVVMRWFFADGEDADLAYASHVLDVLGEPDAQPVAPAIWPLEVANVITRAEAKGLVSEARSSEFIHLLESMAIEVDAETADHALGGTLQLARRFRLSAYDASLWNWPCGKGWRWPRWTRPCAKLPQRRVCIAFDRRTLPRRRTFARRARSYAGNGRRRDVGACLAGEPSRARRAPTRAMAAVGT